MGISVETLENVWKSDNGKNLETKWAAAFVGDYKASYISSVIQGNGKSAKQEVSHGSMPAYTRHL